MSQENVEVIQHAFETYNRHGARTVARDYWHPDIEWEIGPWAIALGGQSHWRGAEQAIANFDELESLLGRFTMEVLDTAEGRDEVFVEARLHGEGLESGAGVDQRFWYAMRVEGSRVRRIRIFDNRAEALEAAGLRE